MPGGVRTLSKAQSNLGNLELDMQKLPRYLETRSARYLSNSELDATRKEPLSEGVYMQQQAALTSPNYNQQEK